MAEFDKSRVWKQVEKVKAGSKLVLKCASVNPVVWFRQKYGIEKLPAENNIVIFNSVQPKDWGVYFCYGDSYLLIH